MKDILKEKRFLIGLTTLFLIFNMVILYPGFQTFDASRQYAQAVSGVYYDWHPPIMAWLFSVLRAFGEGMGPLFTVHVVVYWLGLGFLSLTFWELKKIRTSLLVLLLGLSPSLLFETGIVQKDVGMAVSLLLATGILFLRRAEGRPLSWWGWASFFMFLAYAVLVRSNAIFAAAPILLYALYPSSFRNIGVGCLLFLAVVGFTIPASNAFNHHILQARWTRPIRSLQVFDLAGIANFSGDTEIFWTPSITLDDVHGCYHPMFWDSLGDCPAFKIPPDMSLTSYWLKAIERHPLSYIEHRLVHFNSEMDFWVRRHQSEEPVKLHLRKGTPVPEYYRTRWDLVSDFLYKNPFVSPLVLLTLGLILWIKLYPLRQSKPEEMPFVLVTSGICYMLAFLIVGVASEDRYQYWPRLSIFLSALWVWGERTYFLPKTPQGRAQGLVLAGVVLLVAAVWYLQGDALDIRLFS